MTTSGAAPRRSLPVLAPITPVALAAFDATQSAPLALSVLLPSPKPESRPFDALGALLLASCMSAFLMSLVLSQRPEVGASRPIGLAVSALYLLVIYIRRAGRVPEPIIRPALFADARFAVPNVLNVLANLAGFSILLLTPYYLVNVL